MNSVMLQLTARDPIVARDGRPFGAGQGNRMRGLGWPLPSVVAGSFRTALVKAHPDLDFSGDMPQQLMAIEVAGVFPAVGNELYLPAPSDAVAEPTEDSKAIKRVHRVTPQPNSGGGDFPDDLPVQPVMLSEDQSKQDFKPKPVPAWWPLKRYEEWLTTEKAELPGDWFDANFLNAAVQENRDHVSLDADTGAAADGQLFSTAGLNAAHLPRYRIAGSDPFRERFYEVVLSARVAIPDSDAALKLDNQFQTWHPLGGERRLVHWKAGGPVDGWTCPDRVKSELACATRIRMVLATPAIFAEGWKPGWLKDGLPVGPKGDRVKPKLVGVSNGRWKAVSGWSLQPLPETGRPGPKQIRRMVPAGSVYFFEVARGEAAVLAEHWLKSVSDGEQERRDGFGLAVWGTWSPHE